ncbi:hypothetical protein J4E91_000937 [Alternaria rosae]|nr:hypothetical protein J4E91_000937 [Alternaria rosae]
MALSNSATVGVVIAIFCIVLFIAVALYRYYVDRRCKQNGTSKAATPSSPTGSGSPTPPLQQLMGNQNPQHQQEHTRPSLENGPGPTWVATPEPHASPFRTIRAVPATPKTSSTSAMRPVTGESDKRSSLHQAVLGVSTSHGRRNNSDATKEADENGRIKDMDDDHIAGGSIGRQKTYTGAWP